VRRLNLLLTAQVQTELAEANSVAEEMLSTMTTVRAHAAEDSSKRAYKTVLSKYYRLIVLEAVSYAAYAVWNTFVPASITAVVLFYGGRVSGLLEGSL
jgi:ATP-binding cassette subfamily B (MDR/TAP) protein 9